MATYKEESNTANTKMMFATSLIAGGLAGTVVDVVLYPLDTLKTRMQSKQGLLKAGGFSGLYKGILPVLLGSAPTASLFFVTYEGVKNVTECRVPKTYQCFLHMGAASLAEMVACLLRVPVEVVKQRKQVSLLDKNNIGLRLLYRGYWSTVSRDMPFSLLQFPLWEYFKKVWSSKIDRDIFPVESAICGAVAGGISAAATTPLDVVKTRIMLANKLAHSTELKMFHVLNDVYVEKGVSGLFAGISPRVTWITIGGFIFFGVYEEGKALVTKYVVQRLSF